VQWVAERFSQQTAAERHAPALTGRAIFGATIGNMLEFYDFITYSFFAIQIGHTFFPSHCQFASLMLSLATFGAGFITRPIGGLVIGAYSDRVGEQAVKFYEAEPIGPGRYSPPRVVDQQKIVIAGSPDQAHISTSLVDRQNLTMRMSMRRFTRLTNAFSKKVENLKAAVSLHFCHYNFVRLHKTLRITPAMAAGVDNRLWSLVEELVDRTSK